MRQRFACLVLLLFVALSAPAAILNEGFDDISTLSGDGWVFVNNSDGPSFSWFQGNPDVFPSQAGDDDSYLAVNFESSSSGAISNWAITPVLMLTNDTLIRFYTRTDTRSVFPDSLQVRLSTAGASSNAGGSSASFGDFSALLLAINPTLATGGYPEEWTEYAVKISGLSGPTQGRIGFRYFVDDVAVNGNYVGIDSLNIQDVPEPSTLTLAAAALGLVTLLRRKVARS